MYDSNKISTAGSCVTPCNNVNTKVNSYGSGCKTLTVSSLTEGDGIRIDNSIISARLGDGLKFVNKNIQLDIESSFLADPNLYYVTHNNKIYCYKFWRAKI